MIAPGLRLRISDLPRDQAIAVLIVRDRLAADLWRAGRHLNALRRPTADQTFTSKDLQCPTR